MIEINIDPFLKEKCPTLVIGSINCEIQVRTSDNELIEELENVTKNIETNLKIQDISTLPPIREGRKAYKKLGKDPARYRLSSEALLRRILKGKGLTTVNNIVDINNLTSLKSYHPLCAFDSNQLQPPVIFTVGKEEDEYYGIGRGKLNIANMPVFEDKKGKFGTPTSDSERVKITDSTHSISMNIISFTGNEGLELYMNLLENYLVKYASANNVIRKTIF